MSVFVWDVYIWDKRNEVNIRKAKASNPDDAIFQLKKKCLYMPESGDRVVYCIAVEDVDKQAE